MAKKTRYRVYFMLPGGKVGYADWADKQDAVRDARSMKARRIFGVGIAKLAFRDRKWKRAKILKHSEWGR